MALYMLQHVTLEACKSRGKNKWNFMIKLAQSRNRYLATRRIKRHKIELHPISYIMSMKRANIEN